MPTPTTPRRGRTASVRIALAAKRKVSHIAVETGERAGEVVERLIDGEWSRVCQSIVEPMIAEGSVDGAP